MDAQKKTRKPRSKATKQPETPAPEEETTSPETVASAPEEASPDDATQEGGSSGENAEDDVGSSPTRVQPGKEDLLKTDASESTRKKSGKGKETAVAPAEKKGGRKKKAAAKPADEDTPSDDQSVAEEEISPVDRSTDEPVTKKTRGKKDNAGSSTKKGGKRSKAVVEPAVEDAPQSDVPVAENDEDQPPADEDQPPADAEETPADEDQPPADVEETSADEDQPPADAEETPADEDQPPADVEETPADEDQPPADVGVTLADEDQPPADVEETPADEGTPSPDQGQTPVEAEEQGEPGDREPAAEETEGPSGKKKAGKGKKDATAPTGKKGGKRGKKERKPVDEDTSVGEDTAQPEEQPADEDTPPPAKKTRGKGKKDAAGTSAKKGGKRNKAELEPAPEETPQPEQSEEADLATGEDGEPSASSEGTGDSKPDEAEDLSFLDGLTVNKLGNVVSDNGDVYGRLVEGDAKRLNGMKVSEKGEVWDRGDIIGRVEPVPENERGRPPAPFEEYPDAVVGKDGFIHDGEVGPIIGRLVEGTAKKLAGKHVDPDGDVVDKRGNVKGKAEPYEPEEETEAPAEEVDMSILSNLPINKLGNILDPDGRLLARVVEGEVRKLVGKKADKEGVVWGDSGKPVGKVELVPEDEREKYASAPFAEFPDATVDKQGNVLSNGDVIGKVIEPENVKKLVGMRVDPDGDVLARDGSVLGKAVRTEEEEEEKLDTSVLEGMVVTKRGFVVSPDGVIYGNLVEGDPEELAGRRVNKEGNVCGDLGNVLGRAEPLTPDQRKKVTEQPFEDFPDAVVRDDGLVIAAGDRVIGKLKDGDAKKLAGKKVDASGEILDRAGNVLGTAERYEEPKAEEPAEVDRSVLAGKRVNKAGLLVDASGSVFGKVVEGDVANLIGRSCDREGLFYNDMGTVIGRADVVAERLAKKAGPFVGFTGLKVAEDGFVVDGTGTVVGKLVEGDPVKLLHREVDEDGDIVSPEGNVEGHAERYDSPKEEVTEKPAGPLRGLAPNIEGKVFSADGKLLAVMTDGDPKRCSGKEIDDDGDIHDSKDQIIGHATLLADLPPEPEATPEPTPAETPAPEEEETPEPEPEGPKSLLDGCTVMEDGTAFTPFGQLIGKLTDGKASECAGQKVNEHGVVMDRSGNPVGRVTLLSEIPTIPPEVEEPTESPEEVEKREKLERDRKLAIRMSGVIQRALDKIRPLLRQITSYLDNAAQVEKDQLDEEKVVKTVRPLIQQASGCVEDTLKEIEAMDPTGEARQNARNPDDREPTKEERYLSSLMVELTQDVMGAIDNAKSAIADMPHAKKELEPHLDILGGFLSKLLTGVLLIVSSILELVTGLLGGVLDLGGLLGGLNLGGLVGGLTSGVTGALGGVLGTVSSK